MALLLCKVVLLLLSCRLAQAAALPEGTDSLSSVTPSTVGERVRSQSLLRRIACAFDDCTRSRHTRNVPFSQVPDSEGRDVTERLRAEIVNQMNLRKLWPRHMRRKSPMALVDDNQARLWTVWKRNETVMFGIIVAGTHTYRFLTVQNKSRLCLTAPMPEEEIFSKADDRYFKIEGSTHDFVQSIKHIETGKYIGTKDHRRVILTNMANRADWMFDNIQDASVSTTKL